MIPFDPNKSVFLGRSGDLKLITNHQKSIRKYNSIIGAASARFGTAYKVSEGSNVYYVNKQDLIDALGIVDPKVTDAMIQAELNWQKILSGIQKKYDVNPTQQLMHIPGVKEYLLQLASGQPLLQPDLFLDSFVERFAKLKTSDREKLFQELLKLHFRSENIPENGDVGCIYPFIYQILKLHDRDLATSFLKIFEKFTSSEEQRYAIALKLAETAPMELSFNIEKLALSEEHQYAIALKFIETQLGGTFLFTIKELALSEEHQYAIALKLLETAPETVLSYMEKLALSEEHQYAIALKLLETAPEALLSDIKKLALSEEHRSAIALKLLETAPEALLSDIKKLALSEEHRCAIALKLLETAPEALLRDIEQLTLSEDQWHAITSTLSKDQLNQIVFKLAETAPDLLLYNIELFPMSDEQRKAIELKIQEPRFLYALKLIQRDPSALNAIINSGHFSGYYYLVLVVINCVKDIDQDSLLDVEFHDFEEMHEFEGVEGLSVKVEEIQALLNSLEENEIPNVPWLRKYLENKTPFVQQNVLKWFCKVEILSVLYPKLKDVLNAPVLQQIVKCSTANRYLMTKKILELHLPHQAEALEMWQQLEDKAKNAVHAQIPSVLLACFPPEMKETCMSVLEKIKSKSEREFLRQGPNQALLIATLHQLNESSLSSELKKRLLEGLFEIPLDKRKEVWRLVTDLINFGRGDEITVPLSLEGLKGSMERFFNKKFQIQVEGFYNKFVNTIGRWRNQEALMTWAGGLETLREDDKETAHRFFQDFMRYVLEGNFSDQRMALENPHLETIFKDRSDLKKAWVEQVSLAAEEMAVQKSELKEEEPGERVKRLFATQFLVDRHLGGVEQEMKYPHLTQYLNNPQEGAASIQKISAKMSELEAKVQEGLSMKARNQALAKLKEGDDYKGLQIERAALELLLNEEPSLIKEKTEALIKLLPPNNEFRHDLSGLLHEQSTNESVYTVLDSDHPNDFLLMGTEVEGSCQRVNGDPNKNCCILGYALDGKHRLALVKDAEGRIVARSVLRLLIDSEGNPVLFQERVYVANPDPKWPELIRKIALKKANSLGVPLLISPLDFDNHIGKAYQHPILAGNKPVPFEYVDALGGRHPGPYEINNVRQVNDSI